MFVFPPLRAFYARRMTDTNAEVVRLWLALQALCTMITPLPLLTALPVTVRRDANLPTSEHRATLVFLEPAARPTRHPLALMLTPSPPPILPCAPVDAQSLQQNLACCPTPVAYACPGTQISLQACRGERWMSMRYTTSSFFSALLGACLFHMPQFFRLPSPCLAPL